VIRKRFSHGDKHFLTLLCLAGAFALQSVPCSGAVSGHEDADVRTLAGSGRLGIDDGPSLSSSFLMPVGVAYGTHGEVYVADEAAQRIRKIQDDRVETIAGSGRIGSSGIQVEGGYRDGSALAARFNDPIAVAVSQDGDVYVADSGNHCIRRISHGEVTTFAGSPDRKTPMDGPANVAAFAYPHGLAFDEDNVLYVADFGFGIRRIARNGDIDTVAKESGGNQRFIGISAVGKAPAVTIFADDLDGQYLVAQPARGTNQVYSDNVAESGGGSQRFLYGIAHVGSDQFLATDVKSSSIRIYRLPQPPFVNNASGPIVAGAAAEDPSETAGDVDGDYDAARFYAPLGLAIYRDRVAIADTGNRKIRVMKLPDARRSIAISGNLQGLQRKDNSYRILYLGASSVFFGTSWSKSTPGILERRLNQTRQEIGLQRRAEIETVRIDAADIGRQREFVTNYLPEGAFDLIIFGELSYFLGQSETIEGHDGFESAGIAISRLQQQLGRRTRVMVFVYPHYGAGSFVGGLGVRERSPAELGTAQRPQGISNSETQIKSFGRFASPVPVYSALQDFEHLDATGSSKQLWPFDESHESAAGRRATADSLYRALAQVKPWQ